MKRRLIYVFCVLMLSTPMMAQRLITGTIRDAQTREPLPFASIQVTGQNTASITNENGNFEIELPEGNSSELIVSFMGYSTQRVQISDTKKRITISLTPDSRTLDEIVVVSGTMKEVSRMDSPIPVEIYSPSLFMKNPSASIFESLSMVNGVQPQVTCNVCATGNIQINGMEGAYTMVLIDGMPIVSSLSTVYGLSGIPNSLVKRIEVVKGPASTLYGSEAVGGLINIITKEPVSSPLFKIDVSSTSLLEHNFDIATKWKAGAAQSLLGVNYFNFNNRIDINNDNFIDLTQQERFSVFNKWDLARTSKKHASLALRYVYENRWGGQMQWTQADRGKDTYYGESIYTNRVEVLGKYDLPVDEDIAIDYSFNHHFQDSYYGVTPYIGKQQVAFTQLRWSKKAGSHDLLMGIPFRYVYYDDNTPGTARADLSNKPVRTYLPGIFVQDELMVSSKATVLGGLRYDHHNEHGNIFSPRLSLKYSPNDEHVIRLSGGNGFRVVNLFTEDHAALTGAREVIIKNDLLPERSWNVNLNYATTLTHRTGYVDLDGSIFYTYFTNKIVGDFLTNPQQIIYDNLSGHAISKGITLNADVAFTSDFKVIAGVTLMDVYQRQADETGAMVKVPQLYAPSFSGTYSISYAFDDRGISLDLNGRVTGPMYLPVFPGDYRPEKSPWYNLMNVQITKMFSNGLEVYGGIKNVFNFVPADPLLRPFDPFDREVDVNNPNNFTFDTSYNYAPLQGIKGFAGLRYTIQ